MAKNDKHGKTGDDLDFDFDEFDFEDWGDDQQDTLNPRDPKSVLKKFGSELRREALSPQARRKYLEDALPQNYHTTINTATAVFDGVDDLYNDTVLKEWDKSKGVLKRVIKADGDKLRKFKLGKLVDWANESDAGYQSDYNAEEHEISRAMGQFGGSLKDAMNGGQLTPQERREILEASTAEENIKRDEEENEQVYKSTTVKQQSASVSLLKRLYDNSQRKVDYQDQIDFNYKKKMMEFNLRSLISQRKSLEQNALMRAEIKEGLAAIAKNTSLPDYVKITSQENAKRLLRDKMVNSVSDWAGSRISGTMRAFVDQTKRNIQAAGMQFRDAGEMYADGKEMMDGVGVSGTEMILSMLAGVTQQQLSKRGGGYLRKIIEKNPKWTTGLDLTEALIANSGSYANMAMQGRSGFDKLDNFLDNYGYSSAVNGQNYRLARSNSANQDQAAFMDRKLRTTFIDVYPAWFGKIWKSIEGIRTKKDPAEIEDFHYDTKLNRLRTKSDLQTEFDSEMSDEYRMKNYHDGMDNWINKLDPKGTLTDETRKTIKRWLVQNHSKGKESFAVSLFRGEGLPKGTKREVVRELEEKIPHLAGFDPLGVTMIFKEGAALEMQALRENPEYRRMAKALGNADQQARARHPVDNRRLAALTERYGHNFAVDSGYAKYDAEGNVNVDNENISQLVLAGGGRNYKQRSNMSEFGDIETIPGMEGLTIPSDKDRTPVKRMGMAKDRQKYGSWVESVLQNVNGPRLRGFASGGFTGGDPDKVSGVTHGDEAVVDSTGTKNNKVLLSGIMKLDAPVFKNGQINRTYYRYLGFSSPEDVDEFNKAGSEGLANAKSKIKSKAEEIKESVLNFKRNNFHRDGYDTSYGPTPDFVGPKRTGGLLNNIQEVQDLLRDPSQIAERLDIKGRARNFRDKVRNFDHRKAGESASDYAARAKDAVKKANQSKTKDFDAMEKAIAKAKREGTETSPDEPISLFFGGQRTPFMTKHDFATARYQNLTSGKLISRPSDIMDDIIEVHADGSYTTIATLPDMMVGVYDSRGNEIRLPGLDEGYQRFLKRSTVFGRAIRNTRIGQMVADFKTKVWDDKPVDVHIMIGGSLQTVLKASGFFAAQYLDAESGDILKSHNDIRGAVVNLDGDTLLTVDELAEGIYDSDGYKLKISKLKHWRNVAVTKVENFVKEKFGQMRDKALSRVLDYFEKKQSNDVYVMRQGVGGRELAKAFSMDDLKNGDLILTTTSAVVKKLSDINAPVYSKITKSVVVKKDELEFGFFNEDGTPFKDWKGMTLDERLDHQKDRVFSKLSSTFTSVVDKFKAAWKGKDKAEEDKDQDVSDGMEPCDVYILEDGDLKRVLTKQGFKDHAYRDIIGNIITKPADILSSVVSTAGRILLTTEQITNGLLTEDGREIMTARKKAGPSKEHVRQNSPSRFDRLKSMMGIGRPKGTSDGSGPIDVLIMHEGRMKRVMTADGWKTGAYRDKDGKVINSPSDIDGPVYNFRGDFVLTEEELQEGIYSQDGKIISTKFYKDNGLPGSGGIKGKLSSFGSKIKDGIKSVGSRLSSLRKNSWQWKQAKKEEDERNKKGDVNVTVENKDDDKKSFLGKLLGGLGVMFGGMFTKMMSKFGGMFRNVRNAILLSKLGAAAGGVLGGGPGGGGRGKFGLATKLLGAGVAAGGVYAAHNQLSGMMEDPMAEGDPAEAQMSADEAKLVEAAQAQEESEGGVLGTLSNVNDATGGLAADMALTGAAGLGFKKIMERRRAAKLNAARPGLASRFARGAAGAAGRGVGDAGRAAGAAGRVGGFAASKLGKVGGLAARGAGLAARGLGWALSPGAAAGRLATAGRVAMGAGRLAMGAVRVLGFLSGPVGLAIRVGALVGFGVWKHYQNKKNPLMKFRMAQYGFDFDDQEHASKLLDLEGILSKHVTIDGKGQPSISSSFPEEQVFEIFGIQPDDPKQQEHVQRFIAWWIKRFKPVYLSYVKQTHALLKKFDINQIDDELNKTDKLTLLKGVNFTNKQNNPYLVSASPFLEPAEVPLTMDDVEKAHNKALKHINDMPDDKVTQALDANGEPVKKADDKTKEEKKGDFSWLGKTKTAITDMGNETLKVTSLLATKTDDLFGNWFSKAAENIKGLWGGLSGWVSNASDKLSAKISETWKSLSAQAGKVMEMIAGTGAAGTAVADAAYGAADAAGGAWDSAKNMLGFESNLGDGEKHILAAAKEAGITNPTEIAALLATTAHESGNFRHTEENLRYSASALRKTWPNRFGDPAYAEKVSKGGPQAIANAVYGGRMGNDQPGDGWKYRGRGYIQLTGKSNYAQFAKDTGVDALRNPDLVARPDIGAKAAIWFWKKNGKISQAAQRGDITGVTKIVNGGTNGLSDRKSKFNKYMSKLQAGELKTDVAAPAVVAKQAPSSAGQSATAQKASATIPASIARPAGNPTPAPPMAGAGFVTPDIKNTKAHQMMTDANATNKPDPGSSTPQNQSKATAAAGTKTSNGKVPAWMTVALQELQRGVGENKDLARANQYFADLGFPNYKANAQSWCAAFVSWCLKNSGTPYNKQNPLSAKGGYANWGKRLSKNDIPYGTIVVVGPSHVFFAAGIEGGMVKGLGGNQGKPGEVKYSNFPIASILSVAWPDGVADKSGIVTPIQTSTSQPNTVQAAQQQAAKSNAVNKEANPSRYPEPSVSTRQTATYQAAQQQSTTAIANSKDTEIPALQLQEARTQTKLLTEIRDAITGGRNDATSIGNKTVDSIGGLSKSNNAQVELIAAAVGALGNTLTEFRRSTKPTSLSDSFPISASKT